ncbi:MAG: hypothetical protein JXA87_07815 [Thermoleophilia bacterium]|nr:hypothetical protein [Thermoleophilia bacterium]
MSDSRTDRTDFLGLLAIMIASATSEGWAFPYWNVLQMDAALSGLANALRDGTVPLEAPLTPPTLEMDVGGGYLSAGQVLGVAQTFVDEWGRETEAGTEATIDLGEGIEDPDTALGVGSPATMGSGFEGGLLEVWYAWTDATGGETLASPAAQVNLPYLAAGLYSQVPVTLPATPASVGASGANIYTRHRRGNIVMMTVITEDTETEALLDGDTYNCYRSLPLVNSTGSVRSIKITGVAAPSGAKKTRFYVRVAGQAWTAGDRRLRVGGLDEYDPDTVTYPLTYTGASEEMAPGWPPPTSQVFAIRPIDLATEVTGLLSPTHLEGGGGGAVSDAALNRELLALLELAELADDLAARVNDSCHLDTFKTSAFTGDGTISGMVPDKGTGFEVTVTAGVAVISGVESTYGGGSITLSANLTSEKVWWNGTALAHAADWPGTPHAQIAEVNTDSSEVTSVSWNNLLPANRLLDTTNERLTGPGSSTPPGYGENYWRSKTYSTPNGVDRIIANWKVTQLPDDTYIQVVAILGGVEGWEVVTPGAPVDLSLYDTSLITDLYFRVRIQNWSSPETECRIEDFGAVWDELPEP